MRVLVTILGRPLLTSRLMLGARDTMLDLCRRGIIEVLPAIRVQTLGMLLAQTQQRLLSRYLRILIA